MNDLSVAHADSRRAPPETVPAALPWVLDDETQPRLVLQPIAELRDGRIVGHEVLARFDGPPTAPPDVWFEAAAVEGVGEHLQRKVLTRALALLDALPTDTFLTVNLDPNLLQAPEIEECLLGRARLDRLVLELTEHAPVFDYDGLLRSVARVRDRGAWIAVDDAGAGYAGLQHILTLRPQFVKLDRSLVAGLHVDPVKRSLVETVGALAGSFDAWILAEGVEQEQELQELARLGVPLAQGYLLGRPQETFTRRLASELTGSLRQLASVREQRETIGGLAVACPTLPQERRGEAAAVLASEHWAECVVVLNEWRQPVSMVVRGETGPVIVDRPLHVQGSEEPAVVARRAVSRDRRTRLLPVVCCQPDGSHAGVVGVDRLLARLAQ